MYSFYTSALISLLKVSNIDLSLLDYIHTLSLMNGMLVVCTYSVSCGPSGQRYINITGNAIGPKSGQKDCRKL